MLTQKEIQQLKRMHMKEFGKKVSSKQVVNYTQILLDLLSAVYKKNQTSDSDN